MHWTLERCAHVIVSKVPEKVSIYPKNFLMTFCFLVIDQKLQQNKYTTKMASAVTKSRRRRRQQILGGGGGGAGLYWTLGLL